MPATSRTRVRSRTSSACSSRSPGSAAPSTTGSTEQRPVTASVAEVATFGKQHRGPCRFDGRHDFGIPLRPARLDDRRHAGFERELGPVGEGEERIAGEYGAAHVVPVLARLLERDLDGVDATHLAGADTDRLVVPRDHDRVRGHVTADLPGEEQILELLDRRRPDRRRERVRAPELRVALLHEPAAEDALVVELTRRVGAALALLQDSQRLLPA